MKNSSKRVLFWTPRILAILFAIFVSLFALDVFGEGYGFWKTSEALLMHLIPTGILVVVLLLAWRWEWIGAVAFIALGAYYLVWWRGHWSAYVAISGPLFLLGLLFAINWAYRKELRVKE